MSEQEMMNMLLEAVRTDTLAMTPLQKEALFALVKKLTGALKLKTEEK